MNYFNAFPNIQLYLTIYLHIYIVNIRGVGVSVQPTLGNVQIKLISMSQTGHRTEGILPPCQIGFILTRVRAAAN